ncbi:MAG: hypothetical protein IVW54_21840 [Candidatus Binataceae bacterium]|nr:hypothetical protein [Candidatus Binataceae bacterium]
MNEFEAIPEWRPEFSYQANTRARIKLGGKWGILVCVSAGTSSKKFPFPDSHGHKTGTKYQNPLSIPDGNCIWRLEVPLRD